MKASNNSSPGPLDGIRVLDLSRVLAGPYCTMMLGMLGAEVIKVEGFSGDEVRTWPPNKRDISTPFLALNFNKRGMVLDLKSKAGQEVLKDLVKNADVLVENFKVGTMAGFGLDYDDLRAINPQLVFASITAFGKTGHMANDPGYEAIVQAYSGAMSMTGTSEGELVRAGVSFTDMSTGVTTALAIVTALFRRASTGVGSRVDSSLLQTSLGLMSYQLAGFLMDGVVPRPLGSAHPSVVPYEIFPASDGQVYIGGANQNFYERLCKALDREELIADSRFVGNAERVEHREILIKILSEETCQRTVEDLLRVLRDAGVPIARVNDFREMVADGQVEAIGGLMEFDDPNLGHQKLAGMPFFIDGQGAQAKRMAPRLGEHTREILRELGYGEDRIEQLFAQQVVDGQ